MSDGPYSVAVLIGSLRRDSLNRKMARALEGLAPSSLRLAEVPIGGLPLYNQDLEGATPAWVEFRDRIRAADAVLFVSPEYNRSIPGGLKNAIDVGSRPSGQSAFKGKPAAVISVSPGAIGGFHDHWITLFTTPASRRSHSGNRSPIWLGAAHSVGHAPMSICPLSM